MKMKAYIAGVGMTRFGKHMDTTLKGLACEAIGEAISDAGIVAGAIEAAYMANAAGGVVQGQEMISGQVALREMFMISPWFVVLKNCFMKTSAGLSPLLTAQSIRKIRQACPARCKSWPKRRVRKWTWRMRASPAPSSWISIPCWRSRT
jgi:hypothetical protein